MSVRNIMFQTLIFFGRKIQLPRSALSLFERNSTNAKQGEGPNIISLFPSSLSRLTTKYHLKLSTIAPSHKISNVLWTSLITII